MLHLVVSVGKLTLNHNQTMFTFGLAPDARNERVARGLGGEGRFSSSSSIVYVGLAGCQFDKRGTRPPSHLPQERAIKFMAFQ